MVSRCRLQISGFLIDKEMSCASALYVKMSTKPPQRWCSQLYLFMINAINHFSNFTIGPNLKHGQRSEVYKCLLGQKTAYSTQTQCILLIRKLLPHNKSQKRQQNVVRVPTPLHHNLYLPPHTDDCALSCLAILTTCFGLLQVQNAKDIPCSSHGKLHRIEIYFILSIVKLSLHMNLINIIKL